MKRFILVFLMVLLIGSGALGADLRIAVQDSPATTNPFRARSVWTWRAIGPCLEGLLSRDMDHEIIPWLAKSYEFKLDTGQLVVHLKEDVQWHDGTRFTAEDVAFTYKLIRYFDFPLLSYRLDPVDKVRKTDKFTVTFDLDMEFLEGQESPILYEDLLMQFIVQKAQWQPVFEKAKKAENSIQEFWSWMPDKLQGTGPFKFDEWRKGVYVRLESFQGWHMRGETINGEKLGPYIDGILLKIYRSTDTSVLALKSGEVDYIGWPLQKGYADDLRGRDGITITTNPSNGFYYFAPNLRKQPWDDLAFRRAVDTAIDRDFIVKRILQGQGKALYSVVPPGNKFWHNPNVAPDQLPDNGVQKAKQILKKAGYSWNGRRLVMPDGKKVPKQTIISPPSNYDPLRFYAAQCIQRWMGQLGIRASVKPISFAEIITKVFDRQEFDCFILGFTVGLSPDFIRVFYSSRFSKPGAYNSMGFHSEEFDRLAKQSMLTTDREKRQELIYKMQKLLREKLPVFPLYVRTATEGRNNKFVGWHSDLGGVGSLWSYVLIQEVK